MYDSTASITLDKIDPEALKVIRRLLQHGFDAYLVGGCVRDLLLNFPPKDFDVATNATPQEIKSLFRNCRIIGRRFRLAHIFFGRKIIETSTFRSSPPLTNDPMGETPIIRRDNVFGTAEEDALRRDFTINGLFFDINRQQIIDHVDGLTDLNNRLVRTIGDPCIRIQEDPVRIIRAIKFAVRLNFAIDPATLDAIIEFRGRLGLCSMARVLEEIYRLLACCKGKPAFQLLHETGVLAVLFPEINAMLDPPKNKRARAFVPPIHAHPNCSPSEEQPNTSRKQGEGLRRESLKNESSMGGNPLDEVLNRESLKNESSMGGNLHGETLNCESLKNESSMDGTPMDEVLSGESERNNHLSDSHQGLITLGNSEPFQLEISTLVKRLLGPSDAERQNAVRLFWQHLSALDAILPTLEQTPSHGFLLATVFSGLAYKQLFNTADGNVAAIKLEYLVRTIANRLLVSRKDRERLKQLFLAQRRLALLSRRSRPAALIRRDYFYEAWQFFSMSCQVTGNHQEALEYWRQKLGNRRRRKKRRRSKIPS